MFSTTVPATVLTVAAVNGRCTLPQLGLNAVPNVPAVASRRVEVTRFVAVLVAPGVIDAEATAGSAIPFDYEWLRSDAKWAPSETNRPEFCAALPGAQELSPNRDGHSPPTAGQNGLCNLACAAGAGISV